MKILINAIEDIAKLWQEGKITPSIFRLMNYVFYINIEDGVLLHNCASGELIHLNKKEASHLNDLPCFYDSWMDELIKKHFLVNADSNDIKNVNNLRTALKLLSLSKDITSYTVLPTTNCNARCFYCYEAGCKHTNMSDETINNLVNFIETHHGDKPVHLDWFGGEPLVGINKIDLICKKLAEIEIKFSSSMISNAYLFNEEIINRAKEDWKLNKIQITLDGTKDIYNKTKSYVNACEDPYERVLNNIKLLIEKEIYVSIRLNLGMHNFDDLSKLVDQLCTRFKDRKYLRIYSHILFDDCGFEPTHFSEKDLDLLYEKQNALNEQINKYYGAMPIGELPRLKKYYCMSDNPNCLIVYPSGDFGKCEHIIESNPVGDVKNGITDKQEMKNYAERISYPECDNCVLYPSCIKLKVCQDNTCSQRFVNEKINNIKRTMIEIYNRSLKNDDIQDDEFNVNDKC